MSGVQCKRCGSSVEYVECDHQLGPKRGCDLCDAKGGWWICLSRTEWCQANPRHGHENVKPHTPEFFDEND